MHRVVREYLRANWSVAFLAIVVCIAACFTSNSIAIRSDGRGYHLWTYAILKGDLNFARYMEDYPYAGIDSSDPARGWFHNKYGPGVALIRLPVMVFLADASPTVPQISPAEHRAVLILSALALCLTACLGLRCCRLLNLPNWAGNLAVLAIVFGTGLYHYGTFDASYSHIYSALMLTWFFYLLMKATCTPDAHLPVLATMTAVCLLMLIRNTNFIAIALLSAFYLVEQCLRGDLRSRLVWRNVLLIVAGGVLGSAIQIGLNSYAYGRFALNSYEHEPFNWQHPMQLSVAFSFNQGVFVFYPVLAVVLCAGLLCGKTRRAAFAYALLLFAYVVLYGYWYCWWLGAGFGHRGFVELAPLAIPLLASCLAWSRGLFRIGLDDSGCPGGFGRSGIAGGILDDNSLLGKKLSGNVFRPPRRQALTL